MGEVQIIAEVGQAHDGSLGNAHAYIDLAAATGVDVVKFQTHIADAESSVHEPFRVKFSRQDETRMDYWRRMEFSLEQWKGLKTHCDDRGVEFMSSPFSVAAVELLEEVGVKRYKIGSGEVRNFLMLEKIARTRKPIILSSGMSSYDELDQVVDFLGPFGNELSIMQCTTAYPVPPERTGLNVIPEMIERYDCPVGYSDHSGTIFPALAAVTLGAKLIEVHICLSKKMFGPDTSSSLTPDQLKLLVEGIRFIEQSIGSPVKKQNNSQYLDLKSIFEKSLAVRRDLRAGHVLTIDDLESKKPSGYGIPASDYRKVLGEKLLSDLSAFDFLTPSHLFSEKHDDFASRD